MIRSIFIIFCFVVLAVFGGFIAGLAWGWKAGLIAAASSMMIGFILSACLLLFSKEISWLDILLPAPIAFLWSFVIIIPRGAEADVFAMPEAVAAGLLLTISLWMCKAKALPKYFVALPVVVYLYEMLPVNIPGPFDDWLALGGSATNAIVQAVVLCSSSSLAANTRQGIPIPTANSEAEVIQKS